MTMHLELNDDAVIAFDRAREGYLRNEMARSIAAEPNAVHRHVRMIAAIRFFAAHHSDFDAADFHRRCTAKTTCIAGEGTTSEGFAYELHDTPQGWFWQLTAPGHSRNGPFNTKAVAVRDAQGKVTK